MKHTFKIPEDSKVYAILKDLNLSTELPMLSLELEGKWIHLVDGNLLVVSFDEAIPYTVFKQIAHLRPTFAVFHNNAILCDRTRKLLDSLAMYTQIKIIEA